MPATNSTATLGLPLYVNSDQPKYIPDFNDAMTKIDNGHLANKTMIDNNTGFINNLQTSVNGLTTDLTETTTLATNATNTLSQLALTAKIISGNATNASVLAGGSGACMYIKIEGDILLQGLDFFSPGTLGNYAAPFEIYLPIQLVMGTDITCGFATISTAGIISSTIGGGLAAGTYHFYIVGTLPFNPFTA